MKCKEAPQEKLFCGSTVMIPRGRFHSNNLNNPELGENLTFVRATDRLALLGSLIACVEMLQKNFVLQKLITVTALKGERLVHICNSKQTHLRSSQK